MRDFLHQLAMTVATYRASVISTDPILFVGGFSRSGTTLLTTVLDAHPDIAMGAELLPKQLPDKACVLEQLCTGSKPALNRNQNLSATSKARAVQQFITYCRRAGISPADLEAAIALEDEWPVSGATTLAERARAAWAAMRQRWIREQTTYFGFKLNTSAIQPIATMFPNARFLCLIRDPRDVVHSQLQRKFGRTEGDIASGWTRYATSYRRYAEQQPTRCRLIRYEDMVRAPKRVLFDALSAVGIKPDESMLHFYRGESAMQTSTHPNAKKLRTNFSASAIGAGWRSLEAKQLRHVESACKDELTRFGYGSRSHCSPYRDIPGLPATNRTMFSLPDMSIPLQQMAATAADFAARKRRYDIGHYQDILEPYGDYSNMTLAEYVRAKSQGDTKVLLIRHDIDHDIENAMKLAEWERDRGLRTTYCILHTAWYYGSFEGTGYRHSDVLLRAVDRLLELGHEINFHNNLGVLALQTGCDPHQLLEQELAFFDRRGIPIVGTSTHGDKLCRQLEFRNWEIFRECCDNRFGGPRRVYYTSDGGDRRALDLGKKSMFDFGLEYEAYDIARDVYITDSGGNLRRETGVPGRRTFGRTEGLGETVGILTHPIWWRL